MANSAGVNAYQHLAGLGLGNRALFDNKIVRLSNDVCFHEFSPRRSYDQQQERTGKHSTDDAAKENDTFRTAQARVR
jgi:hypothetical protein